jgi:hypothetical protein
MKNFVVHLAFSLIVIAILFTACSQGNGIKEKLVGKWQIAHMENQYLKQQDKMDSMQKKSMQDSIAKYPTDTAKSARFAQQLDRIVKQGDRQKTQRDSAMKNIRWEFQDHGNFVADEMGKQNKGIWSYDEEHNILFTVIQDRPYQQKIDFAKDTLILHLDSLSYIKWVKTTD